MDIAFESSLVQLIDLANIARAAVAALMADLVNHFEILTDPSHSVKFPLFLALVLTGGFLCYNSFDFLVASFRRKDNFSYFCFGMKPTLVSRLGMWTLSSVLIIAGYQVLQLATSIS